MKNALLRAEFQIFKKMSACVGSRDAIQCKSHHQKMLMRNDNKLERIIAQAGAEEKQTTPEYLFREQKHEMM
jgi:Fe-S cluster biosynthesis and repair protein YggX